jgi:flavin reductase (DIM6/NTAB) family NADH-FMN oxidoreductase RutF
MAVSRDTFRRVLSHFAAGVTVVTTTDESGNPYGLTATAFSSVSLDPPLVLVCVDRQSETHPHFTKSQAFAVNFLAEDQEEHSRRFAVSGGDKFRGLLYRRGTTGVPLLEGSLGYVECRLQNAVEAGDHTIFIGEVVAAGCASEEDGPSVPSRPLLYYRSRYHRLGN